MDPETSTRSTGEIDGANDTSWRPSVQVLYAEGTAAKWSCLARKSEVVTHRKVASVVPHNHKPEKLERKTINGRFHQGRRIDQDRHRTGGTWDCA